MTLQTHRSHAGGSIGEKARRKRHIMKTVAATPQVEPTAKINNGALAVLHDVSDVEIGRVRIANCGVKAHDKSSQYGGRTLWH